MQKYRIFIFIQPIFNKYSFLHLFKIVVIFNRILRLNVV
jgi:hypothetical protein